MSSLLNACLNIATNVWLLPNCGVIYKRNTVFIRTSPCNFSSNSEYLSKQQNSLQSSVVSDSVNKQHLLISSFQIAHMLMKRKKTFCEAESAIKLCLKIIANFLRGGKHVVDEVEKIPLSHDTMNV